MKLIPAAELPGLLPMRKAISLMKRAFVMISKGQAAVAHRQGLALESGTGLVMGAALDGMGIVTKTVSVMPGNRRKGLPGSTGLALLMDDRTGEPRALMDGVSLTAIRTAALCAVATDLLARKDAATALLVGCGTQAAAQLQGLSMVRNIERVEVMGRSHASAAAFISAHQHQAGVSLGVADDPKAAAGQADIIITATNSETPVIRGSWVQAGCHVSAIGSFRKGMCELDSELLLKSSIFVEKQETAASEAGELMALLTDHAGHMTDWTEIGDVIEGKHPGRGDAQEITCFKSVGHSVFDLVAAQAVWNAALEQDAGQDWRP